MFIQCPDIQGLGLSSRPPLQTTEDMQHLLTQAKARLHAYLKAGRPMGMEETHGFFTEMFG